MAQRETAEHEAMEAVAGYFANAGNEIGFALRKAFYRHLFSHLPRQYKEKAEDKTVLNGSGRTFRELAWLKAPYRLDRHLRERQADYQERYPLDSLYERSTCLRWLENLSVLDSLVFFQEAGAFLPKPGGGIRWLDVGSKNWAYVDAIWAFLMAQAQKREPVPFIQIEGIELDPYRRYVDGFHRLDYARHFVQRLPQCESARVRYQAGDILDWQGAGNEAGERYDVISWFLPFVFEDPLLSWGLPRRHFEPEKLLGHVLGLLGDNGALLIVNQTEAEYEEQQRLLGNVTKTVGSGPPHFGLDVRPLGALPESFLPLQYARYATLCQKSPGSGI